MTTLGTARAGVVSLLDAVIHQAAAKNLLTAFGEVFTDVNCAPVSSFESLVTKKIVPETLFIQHKVPTFRHRLLTLFMLPIRRQCDVYNVSTSLAFHLTSKFHTLLHLFDSGGSPPESNFLFLGNYTEQGQQSVRTMCL